MVTSQSCPKSLFPFELPQQTGDLGKKFQTIQEGVIDQESTSLGKISLQRGRAARDAHHASVAQRGRLARGLLPSRLQCEVKSFCSMWHPKLIEVCLGHNKKEGKIKMWT